MIRFLAILALAPFAAHAEPQPAVLELMPFMNVTEYCFDGAVDAEDANTCIGQGAANCMDADSQNQTTVGMMFCALAEHEAWDRLLNREYRAKMEHFRIVDAQEAELFPQFANRADSLLAAQRAWIPFRDADCGLEYALWGSGSMRQIAGSDCRMRMTAKRAIHIRFLGDYMK